MAEYVWRESDIVSGVLVRDPAGNQAGRIIRGDLTGLLFDDDAPIYENEVALVYEFGSYCILFGAYTPAELVRELNAAGYTRA